MALAISVQPVDTASVDGTQYVFTITVTGETGTLVYTWTEYTTPQRSDPTPIGTNSSTLTIAAPGNPGVNKWYDCVVHDDTDSVTSDLAEKIAVPDAANISPTSIAIGDCQSTIIRADILNQGHDGARFFRWERDEGSGYVNETEYAVTTVDNPGDDITEYLLITTTDTSKNGWTYRLSASYDLVNADTIGTFTLTVAASGVQLAARDVTVDTGTPAVLDWFISSCSSATFAWLKGVTTIAGETGETLAFPSAVAADAATYTIKSTNSAGERSASADLVVNDPALDAGGGRRRFYAGNQAY